MRILLHLSERNAGWIIEKIARRLKQELENLGHTVDCSNELSNEYDVIHFMSYAWAQKTCAPCTSFSITHIDDRYKLKEINEKLDVLDIGICFSSHMEQYVRTKLQKTNVTHILPAHDEIIQPRKIIFLITSKIYKDGRKNEQWLQTGIKEVFKSNELTIIIHGSGWDKIVSKLREQSYDVMYHPGTHNNEADYNLILHDLKRADFYVYLGFDEGSMGTLDAKLAGVKCVVSDQGFHQDICDQNDYLFDTYSSFVKTLKKIKLLTQIKPLLKSLSWKNYAKAHQHLWCQLLGVDKGRLSEHNELAINSKASQAVNTKSYEQLNIKNNKSIWRLLQYVNRRPIIVKIRGILKNNCQR
ncbi:hypothetical protein N9X34_04215 [Alphaproteobacteria bacterium]|nr:hypothetical protein [Alphaproteobacteria bacterium]